MGDFTPRNIPSEAEFAEAIEDVDFGSAWSERRPPFYRFVDKVAFTCGVLNTCVIAYCMGGYHWLMPIAYSVSTPLLLLLRFAMYKVIKWHYFMMDFCYFGNLLLLVYLWIYPASSHLFLVSFSIANGPLPWATILFRNSLVFHSLDKMTSVFIHITPAFVTFCLRWYPKHMERSLHIFGEAFNTCVDSACDAPFTWTFVLPLCYFIAHSLFYFAIVQRVRVNKIKNDKAYLTSYRYLVGHRHGLPFKIVNVFGKAGRIYVFGVCQVLYAALSFLPVPLLYHFYWLHLAMLWLSVLVVTWNGGNFYFEVFRFTATASKMAKLHVPVNTNGKVNSKMP